LAAQPLVRHSYKNTCRNFDVNVVGTANVLETFINIIIIITTDKGLREQRKSFSFI